MKKTAYYLLSSLLGLLLSLIGHAVIEYIYLKLAVANNLTVKWVSFGSLGGCALPIWLQVWLLLGGALVGFLLGRRWWRLIYVEKRYSGIINKLK